MKKWKKISEDKEILKIFGGSNGIMVVLKRFDRMIDNYRNEMEKSKRKNLNKNRFKGLDEKIENDFAKHKAMFSAKLKTV